MASKKILITGGAGFIGSHAALRYAKRGWEVSLLDNLSRSGSRQNLEMLRAEVDVEFVEGDVGSRENVDTWFRRHKDSDAILHLASQVAVTTSVEDPRSDFAANAYGTLNVLEGMRANCSEATLVYASTNKVYGALEHRQVVLDDDRYAFADLPRGISEKEPLDFHSPYGCSKGAADQYVRDYGRIYGLKTYVIRQSCIYGTRQFGVEDQGWVAWFALAALQDRQITVYGDGRQVRDILWVDDLLDLYDRCLQEGDRDVFNAGGGVENAISILDTLQHLEGILGRKIDFRHGEWRPGDQRVFISDNTKAKAKLGWEPKTPVVEGIRMLVAWIREHRNESVIA